MPCNVSSSFPDQLVNDFAPLPMEVPDKNGYLYLLNFESSSESSRMHMYDVVAAAETYDYEIKHYVRNKNGEMPEIINVLLIYCNVDSQLCQTVDVKLSLKKINSESTADILFKKGAVMVMNFKEWQMAMIEDEAAGCSRG